VSGRSAGFESVLSQTLPKIAEEAAAEFGVSHGIEKGGTFDFEHPASGKAKNWR
jgi:hypothetical protein